MNDTVCASYPARMHRLPLLALAALAALLVSAPAAFAAKVHRNNEDPRAVRAYWTTERMKNAIPMDRTNRAGGPREHAKPSRPGGSTSSTSTEVPIEPGTAQTALGKVFFSDGTYNYVCSGTALVGNIVWTAGHCVNEGPGAYYRSFVFVPAYRDNVRPYGTFAAPDLVTTERWRTSGDFAVDVGAAIPSTNEFGQELDVAVNERPILFNTLRKQTYKAYGYPAEGKFNGQRLRVCNTAWSRDDTWFDPATMGVPCDMNGGSSGGGWFDATDAVVSVNSYGYGSLKNVMFGPHLESEARALYDTAVAAAAAG